jgi:hypothetical protein
MSVGGKAGFGGSVYGEGSAAVAPVPDATAIEPAATAPASFPKNALLLVQPSHIDILLLVTKVPRSVGLKDCANKYTRDIGETRAASRPPVYEDISVLRG